jgi:hypothetical protein
MKSVSILVILLVSLGVMFSACETDVSEDRDSGPYYAIELGQVTVGEYGDTCITVGPDETDGSISGTVIIDCPGFHFTDVSGEEAFDTLAYDLTYPEDTVICVRFEPEEAVPAGCSVELGPELGRLELDGIGVLPGYDYMIFHPGTSVDLYDIEAHEVDNWIGASVYGDSGTVMHADMLPIEDEWEHACGGSLPPCTFRDTEPVYVQEPNMWSMVVGGGGGYNGLAFPVSVCEDPIVFEGMEYITSSYVRWAEENVYYMWFVGKGNDISYGHNGMGGTSRIMISFTLDQPTSEISGIDGSDPEDVWAVLNQPRRNLYHFDGESWESGSENWMTASLQDIWVHGSGQAFAVGSNGAVYHYTGSAWVDQSIDFERGTLFAVTGNSPSDVYAVGEDMAIYHYDGEKWGIVPTPPDLDATLYGIDMCGESPCFFVAGERGTVIGYAVGAYW